MSALSLNQKIMHQLMDRQDFLIDALHGTEEIMEETYRNELIAEGDELAIKIADLADTIFKHSGFNCLSRREQTLIEMCRGDSEPDAEGEKKFIENVLHLSHPNLTSLRACLATILTLPEDDSARKEFLTRLFDKAKEVFSHLTSERLTFMLEVIAAMNSKDREQPFKDVFHLIPYGPFPNEMLDLAQSLPFKQKIATLETMALRSANANGDSCRFIDRLKYNVQPLEWFIFEHLLFGPMLSADCLPSEQPIANRQTFSGLLELPLDALEDITSGLTSSEKASLRQVHSTFHYLHKKVALNEYLEKKAELKECARFFKKAFSDYSESLNFDFDTLILSYAERNHILKREYLKLAKIVYQMSLDQIRTIVSDFSRLHLPFSRPICTCILDLLLAHSGSLERDVYNRGQGDDSNIVRGLQIAFLISDKKIQWKLIELTLTFSPLEDGFSKAFILLIHATAREAPAAHLTLSIEEFFNEQRRGRDAFWNDQMTHRIDVAFARLAQIEDPVELAQEGVNFRNNIQTFFQNSPIGSRDHEIELLTLCWESVSDFPLVVRNEILDFIFEQLIVTLQDGPLSAEERAFVVSIVHDMTDDHERRLELFARIGFE